MLRLLYHALGQIDGGHVIAARGKNNGVKSRAGADVKHLERPSFGLREVADKLVGPFAVPAVGEIFADNLGVGACAACPILLYRACKCAHCHFSDHLEWVSAYFLCLKFNMPNAPSQAGWGDIFFKKYKFFSLYTNMALSYNSVHKTARYLLWTKSGEKYGINAHSCC